MGLVVIMARVSPVDFCLIPAKLPLKLIGYSTKSNCYVKVHKFNVLEM